MGEKRNTLTGYIHLRNVGQNGNVSMENILHYIVVGVGSLAHGKCSLEKKGSPTIAKKIKLYHGYICALNHWSEGVTVKLAGRKKFITADADGCVESG